MTGIEIQEAIFDIANDKSPGLDGLYRAFSNSGGLTFLHFRPHVERMHYSFDLDPNGYATRGG